jgi:hypothetical protein
MSDSMIALTASLVIIDLIAVLIVGFLIFRRRKKESTPKTNEASEVDETVTTTFESDDVNASGENILTDEGGEELSCRDDIGEGSHL